jgi:hypothetical protein
LLLRSILHVLQGLACGIRCARSQIEVHLVFLSCQSQHLRVDGNELFKKYCGPNLQNIQLLITDIGPKSFIKIPDPSVVGLFAADSYLTLIETGAANIDWSDLHGGTFLDDKRKPGSAFFGFQMIHQLMSFNETLVTAVSGHSLRGAHAATHKNGSLSLMLVNKDPKNTATVKVTVDGDKLAGPGMRFDYNKTTSDKAVPGTQIDEVGNSFTVIVPPYTITDLLIPQAK